MAHCTLPLRWGIVALTASIILACAVMATVVLAVFPGTSSFEYHYKGGDTFVVPLQPSSFWFHSVTLQTDPKDKCTGAAVVVPCGELKPKFTTASRSENTQYLTEGSVVYFHVNLENSSHLSSHYRLWVFSNYERYSLAILSTKAFDGLSCANPNPGDWCREITTKTPPILSYNITRRGYYYVACQPEGRICLGLDYTWVFYQGYYDIHDYTNWESHLVAYSEPKTIPIQSFFQFSSTEQCLLVAVSSIVFSGCRDSTPTQLMVGNIINRPDVLLFPLLVATLSLLLIIISLSCCFRQLWRSRMEMSVTVEGNLHEFVVNT